MLIALKFFVRTYGSESHPPVTSFLPSAIAAAAVAVAVAVAVADLVYQQLAGLD